METTKTNKREGLKFRIGCKQFGIRKAIKKGEAINGAAGRIRCLTGGVWADNEGYLYNCKGELIGKTLTSKEGDLLEKEVLEIITESIETEES